MKWRWLYERRWRYDGTWVSITIAAMVAVILVRNLFDEHVVMQRYCLVNLVALCLAVMSAVRDLVVMIRERNVR